MPAGIKQKILIVEDNQENIDLLVYFLKPQGYELIAVNDGIEAMKAVEEEMPDLILLDIMLPKMNGFQVCERLKKNNNTKAIPIIMLTALKELKDKIRSLEVGADDFIMKPFENVELLARVRSLLRLKEFHDELELKNRELQRTNESLLRMDRFKEDLINLIVHDMKNPLFVIQGNLQMMTMGLNGAQVQNIKKYINRIERSSQMLLRMVVNLIDISRIQEGTMVLKKEPVDLNGIIKDIVNRIKDYPENANKVFSVRSDRSLPSINLDFSIMERVVENLVNFAASNIQDSGKVELETTWIENQKVRIVMTDSGARIPEKFHDKIFEKFSQAEIKKDGYRVGRGLSLTFCKMAVQAHGGNMWLDVSNPVGNRFILEVPASKNN